MGVTRSAGGATAEGIKEYGSIGDDTVLSPIPEVLRLHCCNIIMASLLAETVKFGGRYDEYGEGDPLEGFDRVVVARPDAAAALLLVLPQLDLLLATAAAVFGDGAGLIIRCCC